MNQGKDILLNRPYFTTLEVQSQKQTYEDEEPSLAQEWQVTLMLDRLIT